MAIRGDDLVAAASQILLIVFALAGDSTTTTLCSITPHPIGPETWRGAGGLSNPVLRCAAQEARRSRVSGRVQKFMHPAEAWTIRLKVSQFWQRILQPGRVPCLSKLGDFVRYFRTNESCILESISLAHAVIEFELDGTIRHANPLFLALMGYQLEEIKGKHHSIFVEQGYAASAEYRASGIVCARGRPAVAEFPRYRKDGEQVWIHGSYNPVMNRGRKKRTRSSRSRRIYHGAEAPKRVLKDSQLGAVNSSQAVIEFNLDGTVRNANPNFLQALGYTLNEIVVGRHHAVHAAGGSRAAGIQAVLG